MINKNIKIKDILLFVFFIVFFFLISLLSLRYGAWAQELIDSRNFLNVAVYILFLIVADVVAPISSLPILPIAVSVWGSFWAAIITLVGWIIAAIISFWLARRFGRPLVAKVINLEKAEKLAAFIPEKNLFWVIVILRIFFPVEIFNYALGLFTKVNFWSYFWGTLVGIIPFGFLFAYGVGFPIQYQLAAGFVALLGFLFFYNQSRRKILEWIKAGLKI